MTTTETTPDLAAQLKDRVNARIDEVRTQLGFTKDAELAEFYGVQNQRISYWRNLKGSRLDTVLTALLLGVHVPSDAVDDPSSTVFPS